MTWYLTIRSDARYSRTAATRPLVEHLRTLPELVEVSQMDFRNAPGSPWVSLILALADESGNYATDGDFRPTVNVVELVCGEGDEGYDAFAGRIASFLSWEAVETHENRRVYPPG
jgi:hypothetical protein